MEVFPNPFGIPNSKFNGLMSLLNESGGLAVNPQLCKELIVKMVGQDIALNYGPAVYDDNRTDGRINQKCPALVMWMKAGTCKEVRMEKIHALMEIGHLLAETMGTNPPVVHYLDKTDGGMVIFIDPYYLRSPVTLHGLLTFYRAAITKNRPTSSIYAFIESVVFCREPCADGAQLNQAIVNDNLYGFLNKSLSCSKRNGLDDWLVKTNGMPYDSRYIYVAWNGLVGYKEENQHPDGELHSMDYLNMNYGRVREHRIPRGENYSGWNNNLYLAI